VNVINPHATQASPWYRRQLSINYPAAASQSDLRYSLSTAMESSFDDASKTEIEASCDRDGFTMDFSLDVVSDIEQDVEDVARQGALGNFRNARGMFEEALNKHRDQFPVYAEYLRLCLDGGDWNSLAEASDYGCGSWTSLASNIVRLLRAVGEASTKPCNKPMSEDFYVRTELIISVARDLDGQLGSTRFEDFDNEQVQDIDPQTSSILS
jgi:hypothetical protein